MVLRESKIQIPAEEQYVQGHSLRRSSSRDEKMDGVCMEGEMTYNVTEKNIKQAENQILNLKEENYQIREERDRLKEQLKEKERSKYERQSEEKSSVYQTTNNNSNNNTFSNYDNKENF